MADNLLSKRKGSTKIFLLMALCIAGIPLTMLFAQNGPLLFFFVFLILSISGFVSSFTYRRLKEDGIRLKAKIVGVYVNYTTYQAIGQFYLPILSYSYAGSPHSAVHFGTDYAINQVHIDSTMDIIISPDTPDRPLTLQENIIPGIYYGFFGGICCGVLALFFAMALYVNELHT